MRSPWFTAFFTLAVTCQVQANFVHAQVWSPDGLWLAYSTPYQPLELPTAVNLQILLGDECKASALDPWLANQSGGGRLWCTRAQDGESVLIDEQNGGWITEPAWSPDGHALAYGRVIDRERQAPRFELVIRSASQRSQVISSWDWFPPTDAPFVRVVRSVTWSPDGSSITVPSVADGKLGLLVVAATDGKTLHAIPDAFLPAWSPDGRTLAYYVASAGQGADPALALWNSEVEHPRLMNYPAPSLLKVAGPPAWFSDGQLILFPSAKGADLSQQVDQLVIGLLPLPDRRTPPNLSMAIPADARTGDVRVFEIAVDPMNEGIITSHAITNKLSTFTWFRGGPGAVYKRLSPFDKTSPFVAMAINSRPGFRRIACRILGPNGLSPPALFDPDKEFFTPVAPDKSTNLTWQFFITQGILELAAGSTTGNVSDLKSRPTLFPIPGELPEMHPGLVRMRKLAQQAVSLQRKNQTQIAGSSEFSDRLDSQLVVALAGGEYATASGLIDLLANEVEDTTSRLRLQGLRAQVYLAMGDKPRAMVILTHLRELVQRDGLTIEEFADRIQTREPSLPSSLSWVDHLGQLMEGHGKIDSDSPSEAATPFGMKLPGDDLLPGQMQGDQGPDFEPAGPPPPSAPPGAPRTRPRL